MGLGFMFQFQGLLKKLPGVWELAEICWDRRRVSLWWFSRLAMLRVEGVGGLVV